MCNIISFPVLGRALAQVHAHLEAQRREQDGDEREGVKDGA